eukprot:TRINITY_DN549_c0_g1_i1.p1 TRINITY_DN549_c0_g1~~TRINITY_DN549_c0_g1_i1.p1  ORF type:complete len:284 (-),score=40.77 TRINITY_DN549_c0_g1_i1:397-1248(-)
MCLFTLHFLECGRLFGAGTDDAARGEKKLAVRTLLVRTLMASVRRPRALITRAYPPIVMEPYAQLCDFTIGPADTSMPREELLRRLADVEILVSRQTDGIDEELLQHAPKLKLISSFGAGVDTIDLNACNKRGIWVANTPDVVTDATATLAMTLLLCVSRRVTQAESFLRAGRFSQGLPFGRDPERKILGLLGMGRIGMALAKRASAFDMQIIYHNRKRLDADAEQRYNCRYVSFAELLQTSDYISVHTPLTPDTKHLLDKPQFDMMKRGVYIINTARGPAWL